MCGLRNRAIQEELLIKRDLPLKRAQQIAEGMEDASKNTQQLNPKTSPALNVVRKGEVSCYKCGKETTLLTNAGLRTLPAIPATRKVTLRDKTEILPTRKSRRKGRNKCTRAEEELW